MRESVLEIHQKYQVESGATHCDSVAQTRAAEFLDATLTVVFVFLYFYYLTIDCVSCLCYLLFSYFRTIWAIWWLPGNSVYSVDSVAISGIILAFPPSNTDPKLMRRARGLFLFLSFFVRTCLNGRVGGARHELCPVK